MLPYGRQSIDADDIAAVVEVLQGDWLTTGPAVRDFEAAVSKDLRRQLHRSFTEHVVLANQPGSNEKPEEGESR